jgi:hypothetical protein
MNVTINENEISIPEKVSTWGQLIDWLETDYLTVGHCITRVAVDGEEDVNYRSPAASEKVLAGVGRIQVESSEFDLVVRESLNELEHEINVAIEASNRVVSLMEARDEVAAYTALAQLLDTIRIFFAITSEDLGWVDPPNAEILRPEIPAVLERALGQLISAQESRSWLLLCDIIQYEFLPIRESWKAIIHTTRVARNAA